MGLSRRGRARTRRRGGALFDLITKPRESAEAEALPERLHRLLAHRNRSEALSARLIHRPSPRVKDPFFSLSSAAIAQGLAWSELFGREPGSLPARPSASAGWRSWPASIGRPAPSWGSS